MKTLLLLIFMTLHLFGAYPKTYSAMGTPLYKTIPSITHLSKARVLRQDKPQFLNFIKATAKTKKLGFWCDKNRKNPNIAEKRAQYIKDLRVLIKQELKLEKIIVKKMNLVIDKNMSKTYIYLKKSKYSVFKTDKVLRAKMARYDKRLKKYKKSQQKKAAKQSKQNKAKQTKALRSSKNLNGLWQAKNKKENITLLLKGSSFSMTNDDGAYIFTASGTYTAKNKAFILSIISITQSKKGKNPHTRHAALNQTYSIKRITKTQLWIQKPHTDILKFTKK